MGGEGRGGERGVGRWCSMIVHQPVWCTDGTQLSASWLDRADIYIDYGINTWYTLPIIHSTRIRHHEHKYKESYRSWYV